ncbi:hypothetical protein ACQPZX_22210 [Actinoplanes sp. CA-142083]|uniref:hypothetical protein n=1 Tax=Actinoplanes sp. CA-142083 TaxID=3239903 RepID=UPI003D9128C8
MSDKVERMLDRARADAMRDVVPPGVDNVRRAVRRTRTVINVGGAALLTAATIGLTVLVGQAGPSAPSGSQAAGGRTSAEPSFPVRIPEPDPTEQNRMDAASAALGDPNVTPWTMATAGMVAADYENHVNDIPEGDYHMYVFCVGEGTVQVTVKAQDFGNQVLATGSVPCGEDFVAGELKVHQPITGYLRVYLSGDSRANAGAAFAFKFVNTRGEPSRGSLGPR